MCIVVMNNHIGTFHILLFAQLALHTTANRLFTGPIAKDGTPHASSLWRMHQAHRIYIGIHLCLKEYGALHCHHSLSRLLSPCPKVCTHHRMHNAINQGHTLWIAKHIRSQIGPIELPRSIVHLCPYSTDECFTDNHTLAHQTLGFTVTIINRNTHQTQQA